MTTGRTFATFLCALGLAACELLVRPDDVPPPGERADASSEPPDASCRPKECAKDGCGVIADDGCGSPLNCGKCLAGMICEDHACVTPCTPESDVDLCNAAGAQCGTLSVADRCGKPRTPACGGACPAGTVCGGNAARPNACACNETSCLGTTHCDAATGSCVAGCSTAAQCPTGGECVNNTCVCPGGGHECSGACVPNDVAHCGTACVACPTDPNGTASCDGAACKLTCKSGFNACSSACASCPDHAKSYGCGADGKCIATECDTGYSACDGACCGWQIDTVTTSAAGGRLAIAVDANDVSHLAWYASASKEVRWGRRNPTGNWTVETVDPTGSLYDDQIVSVATTAANEPALLYLDGKGSVRLAERKKPGSSNTWTKSAVYTPLSPSAPVAPALVAQADGTLHAVFGEDGSPSSPYSLYYATRAASGSTWSQETVETADALGLATAIALDAAGKPSLAAVEIGVEKNYDDGVYYFSKGAAWIREEIDTGELGYSLSVAVGASGIQVGFPRGYLDTLVHATRASPWKLQDALTNAAKDDACLVLDAQGNPHFAYVSSVSGSLRHAWLSTGGWVSEQVDTNAAGVWAAVDKEGRLRIVYRSSASGAVKHAFVGK